MGADEYTCPSCGRAMKLLQTRDGSPFLGCSGYPECKTTMIFDAKGRAVPTVKPTEYVCEKCGRPMVLRQVRRGPFLMCMGYPSCKNAKEVGDEPSA